MLASGFGTVLWYRDRQWKEARSGETWFYGLWSNSPADIFAVGTSTILHWDGGAWWPMTSPGSVGRLSTLHDAWGSSYADVFAVGDYGDILHFDGIRWTEMSSGTSSSLEGVWGSGSRDVWAVGHPTTDILSGSLFHYDGVAWRTVPLPLPGPVPLHHVWGSAPDDVFAVGGFGRVLHFDGRAWSVMESGTTRHLFGVWGSSAKNVYAVGQAGTVLHFDGAAWRAIELPFPVSTDLHSVWLGSGTDVRIVGDAGTILRGYR